MNNNIHYIVVTLFLLLHSGNALLLLERGDNVVPLKSSNNLLSLFRGGTVLLLPRGDNARGVVTTGQRRNPH